MKKTVIYSDFKKYLPKNFKEIIAKKTGYSEAYIKSVMYGTANNIELMKIILDLSHDFYNLVNKKNKKKL
jgi:hypothetical protein